MNKEELKNLFGKRELLRVWPLVEAHIKNAIQFKLKKAKQEKIAIGQSKIGGNPDLPSNVEWFTYNGKSMSFLAQINLAEVKPFDLENKLPPSGILYFFYDAEQESWGFDPEDKGCSKVFFYNGDISTLERKATPKDLDEWAFFNSCSLKFQSVVNIPDYQSSLMENIEFTDDESDNYFELREELNNGEDISTKLLGHSDNVQGGMELECELVTNGLYCGDETGYNDKRAKELEKNIDQWELLFQLDSNDEAGMMWGDVGCLYFWIKKDDLKNQNFENNWLISQCC